MNIRRQAKMLYVWYPKKQGDWDAIHQENDIIEIPEKIASVKKQLKQGKHPFSVMRTEHLDSFVMKPLQDYGKRDFGIV